MENHEFDKTYKTALELINLHHKDMTDKGNNPYIEHLLYVSNNCINKDAKIAGLLHDILEDTDCTEQILIDNNISTDVINAIKLLTKPDNETYANYIDNLVASNNIIALEVKFWDLSNNMDLSRLETITERDLNRVKKRYKPAQKKILEKLNELNVM